MSAEVDVELFEQGEKLEIRNRSQAFSLVKADTIASGEKWPVFGSRLSRWRFTRP